MIPQIEAWIERRIGSFVKKLDYKPLIAWNEALFHTDKTMKAHLKDKHVLGADANAIFMAGLVYFVTYSIVSLMLASMLSPLGVEAGVMAFFIILLSLFILVSVGFYSMWIISNAIEYVISHGLEGKGQFEGQAHLSSLAYGASTLPLLIIATLTYCIGFILSAARFFLPVGMSFFIKKLVLTAYMWLLFLPVLLMLWRFFLQYKAIRISHKLDSSAALAVALADIGLTGFVTIVLFFAFLGLLKILLGITILF
jgi:hypothetical protein